MDGGEVLRVPEDVDEALRLLLGAPHLARPWRGRSPQLADREADQDEEHEPDDRSPSPMTRCEDVHPAGRGAAGTPGDAGLRGSAPDRRHRIHHRARPSTRSPRQTPPTLAASAERVLRRRLLVACTRLSDERYRERPFTTGASASSRRSSSHGHPRRHQRLRPHRSQRASRLPRRVGARVRRRQRHHRRRRRSRTSSSTTPSTARSTATVHTAEGKALARRRQAASRCSPSAIPAKLPWKDLGVDVVLECTGLFTDRDKAAQAPRAPAPRRSSSRRPAKGADLTVCYGVNHTTYDPAKHHVISNASCTTNCLAPVAKVLHETFGIKRGLMTTIHSYTNDQRILDLPHEDLRRARAAALSMIPTTTGAAQGDRRSCIPELEGQARRHGGPRADAERLARRPHRRARRSRPPRRTINAAMQGGRRRPAEGHPRTTATSRSSRSTSTARPYSSIFDARSPASSTAPSCKVLSWYDNEWGFSNRMRDVAAAHRREAC